MKLDQFYYPDGNNKLEQRWTKLKSVKKGRSLEKCSTSHFCTDFTNHSRMCGKSLPNWLFEFFEMDFHQLKSNIIQKVFKSRLSLEKIHSEYKDKNQFIYLNEI